MEKAYVLYLDAEGDETLLAVCATLERAKIEARNKVIEEAQLTEEDAAGLPDFEWDEYEDEWVSEVEIEADPTDPDADIEDDWDGTLRIEEHVFLT